MLFAAPVFALPSATRMLAAGEFGPIRSLESRTPDTKGMVYVLEYHHIRSGRGPMFRTPRELVHDLERLWRLGFRPVTVAEYATNRMPLPKGASPVILTFDDAHPSQLHIRPDGTVDPKCAVGILMAFAKKHPDFPAKATFYVLPNFFGQRKYRAKKVKILQDLGCEIGTHTMTHPQLSRLSDEGVKREIAGISDFVGSLGVKGPYSFAPPYGLMPRNRLLVKGFTYRGKTYRNLSNAYAFYGPAFSPNDPRFSPFAINRIVAEKGQDGIEHYLSRAALGKVHLYVSPGGDAITAAGRGEGRKSRLSRL
ncbi:MAG: hypothetical protein C4320_04665 [Armatimonadota bacterium]